MSDILAQIDVPIDELQELGQSSINIEGMLVMTLFIFALSSLVFMLAKLRTGNKNKGGDMSAVLETLADVIAGKLKDVHEEAQQDREMAGADRAIFMESFAVLSRGQTSIIETERDIAQLLAGHGSKVDANQIAITQLGNEQQSANQQVANMNGDIIEIKQLLRTALQALDTLSKNLLLILEKMEAEAEVETPTEEAPKIKPEKPGVSVTPKPINDDTETEATK
jgi:hypothetical protein